MRNTIAALCVACLLAFTATGSASIMTYDGMGLYSQATLHAAGTLADGLTTEAGQIMVGYAGTQWLGYCVDLNAYVATDTVTELPVTSLYRGQQVAYLFESHADAVTTALQAAALQVAIWELVYEAPGGSLDASSGYFSVTGNTQVSQEANALLANLPLTYSPNGTLMVLHTDTHQDLLIGRATNVPEPATMSLLALGGVALLRRR